VLVASVLGSDTEAAMRVKEYFGESPVDLLTPDHLQERLAAGWKLVALEWERSGDEPGSGREAWTEEIPYGLQISSDCLRLVENPGETQVIVAALDMIVDDCPLSRVTDELNRQGYSTRDGKPWTKTALFNLMPRMIQVGPRVFSSERWITRRQHSPRAV
jgi:hypothetical protein